MPDFRYCSGETVYDGDAVAIVRKPAVIESVFTKGTQAAHDFGCFETGGVLIRFEDGDLQLWPWMNEDLEFQKRAGGPD